MDGDLTYRQLEAIFTKYFNLGFIASDINTKFALISLICFITTSMKKKKPDVTYYKVVNKLCEGTGLDDNEIKGLAILCENFGYECTEFPTFNIKPADMPKTVKGILKKKLPF
jgi:hypothetical protein